MKPTQQTIIAAATLALIAVLRPVLGDSPDCSCGSYDRTRVSCSASELTIGTMLDSDAGWDIAIDYNNRSSSGTWNIIYPKWYNSSVYLFGIRWKPTDSNLFWEGPVRYWTGLSYDVALRDGCYFHREDVGVSGWGSTGDWPPSWDPTRPPVTQLTNLMDGSGTYCDSGSPSMSSGCMFDWYHSTNATPRQPLLAYAGHLYEVPPQQGPNPFVLKLWKAETLGSCGNCNPGADCVRKASSTLVTSSTEFTGARLRATHGGEDSTPIYICYQHGTNYTSLSYIQGPADPWSGGSFTAPTLVSSSVPGLPSSPPHAISSNVEYAAIAYVATVSGGRELRVYGIQGVSSWTICSNSTIESPDIEFDGDCSPHYYVSWLSTWCDGTKHVCVYSSRDNNIIDVVTEDTANNETLSCPMLERDVARDVYVFYKKTRPVWTGQHLCAKKIFDR